MTTPPTNPDAIAPDYYNPAKDVAKLTQAMSDPLPFDGWPSRWKRCLAADVLAQVREIEALREALQFVKYRAVSLSDAQVKALEALGAGHE